MAMTWEQVDTLVARLEREAKRHPSAYKLRVFLLAVLGYAYIFFILALLLLLMAVAVRVALSGTGASFAAKLFFAMLALTSIIFRALWVRLPTPDGNYV